MPQRSTASSRRRLGEPDWAAPAKPKKKEKKEKKSKKSKKKEKLLGRGFLAGTSSPPLRLTTAGDVFDPARHGRRAAGASASRRRASPAS